MPRAPTGGNARRVSDAQLTSMFPGERSRILVASAAARGQNKPSFFYRSSRTGQLFEVVFTRSGPSSIKKNHGIAYGHKDDYDGSGSYFGFDKISKFVRNAAPYAMGAAEMMAPELIPAIEGATEAANLYNQFTGRGAYHAQARDGVGSFIRRIKADLRQGLPCYYINHYRLREMNAGGTGARPSRFYMYCKLIENEGDLVEAVYDDDKYVFDSPQNVQIHEKFIRLGPVDDDGYDTDQYIPHGDHAE